jgi:hypothetical protein
MLRNRRGSVGTAGGTTGMDSTAISYPLLDVLNRIGAVYTLTAAVTRVARAAAGPLAGARS